MVSLSKLLDQGLRDAKCQDVFHPGRTCVQFQFQNSHTFLITCLKFFLPVAAIPLIMKGKNLRKRHIWDAVKYWLEASIAGFFMSQTVPIALCKMRALCGYFNKHTFIYGPIIFVTWAIFFTSAKVVRLYSATVFQVILETVLRNGRNPVSRTISQSKLIQTLMFMMCSAFVLHTAQRNILKIVWIVRFIPSQNEDEKNKCPHDGPCSKLYFKELLKNLMIGIPLDLIKTFSDAFQKRTNIKSSLKSKLLSLDFPTTLFLSSYASIYRLTSCLLSRTWKRSPQIKHIVAAFLGGVSFYILPKPAMLCYGASVCLEIFWEQFKRHKHDNKVIERIKKIPFARIYLSFGVAYLVHLYIFRIHLVNPVGLAIVSAMTGNRGPFIRDDIYKYFERIDKTHI